MTAVPAAAETRVHDLAFWRLPAEELLTKLGTQREGLSQKEAAARTERYGLNLIEATKSRPLASRVLARLLNPLVAILIAAAAISGISGDYASLIIIIAVISLSLTLDIFQEHRAEQAAAALRHSVAIHADVLRDGLPLTVPIAELVPGDIIQLRIGDLIPATAWCSMPTASKSTNPS